MNWSPKDRLRRYFRGPETGIALLDVHLPDGTIEHRRVANDGVSVVVGGEGVLMVTTWDLVDEVYAPGEWSRLTMTREGSS